MYKQIKVCDFCGKEELVIDKSKGSRGTLFYTSTWITIDIPNGAVDGLDGGNYNICSAGCCLGFLQNKLTKDPDAFLRQINTELYKLSLEIESAGASDQLTKCVVMLGETRDRIKQQIIGKEKFTDEFVKEVLKSAYGPARNL